MPHADDEFLEEVPESSTARIALVSIFYILLASIQYFYKKYILENLGWGKLNQFIDLCSVSNVSFPHLLPSNISNIILSFIISD